ncbi:lantibiotic dehydratase [Streptomyces chartreusis]|uniref:lantibiotic dehydratase n=1 Tax=Streptomyces chartreusis TaxID=1969 RepID=UPI003630EFA0
MKSLPDPVVRVAGVKPSALAALRTPRSHQLAESVLTARDEIAEEGRRIADDLHRVIGELTDPALRPRLIGLRRAAHQSRAPRSAEWDDSVRSALTGPVAARVQRWIDAREECAERAASLADVLGRETRDSLVALRDTLKDPRFRQGLLHASPGLDDVLQRWLAAPAGTMPATKALVSLARYLSRATVKTSPQGAFTATGQARWTDRSGWLWTGDLERRLIVAELNLARLRRIVDALLRGYPALRDTLSLRTNPALNISAGTVRLITPGSGARVAAHPAPDPLPSALAGVDGVALADAGSGVRRFVTAGLLQADVPPDDLDACPLESLVSWLNASGSVVPDETVGALAALGTALRQHPGSTDHAALRSHDRLVRDRLDAMETRLGLGPPDEPYARPPFHEDSVFEHEIAMLGRKEWQPLLTDLASVGAALAVLDRDLPARHAAAAWFTERYGPNASTPLLVLLHDLQEDRSSSAQRVRDLLHPGFGVDEKLLWDSPLSVLHRLADQRAEVLRALTNGRPPTSAQAPRPPLSLAYYVQPLPGPDGRPGAVVNVVTVGHGHWQGRLDRIGTRADGRELPASPAPRGTESRIPVDIGGLYASNTNLRYRTLPYHFDHPFTRGPRDAPGRIPLGEVTAYLDATSGLIALRAPSCDADLVPVHLGLMSPLLLPPPLTTVLRLFGDPHTLLRTGHPLLPGPFTDEVPQHGVLELPRIELGRVVLRRRGRLTRARAVPRREPGESEHSHLLRLLAWRRKLGPPERCFVRTRVPGPQERDTFADKGYKPAYVDFASYLLTTAFTRSLGDPDTVVHMEESLPDPADTQGATPYTAEFIVELPGDFHAQHS